MEQGLFIRGRGERLVAYVVLLAMGLSERDARGALRLTLGHTSTPADVRAVLAALPAAIDRARRAAGVA